MGLDKQSKIKIAARLFYQDDNDYSSYEEAVKEMTLVDEFFLDSTINFVTAKNNGYRKLMRDIDGHVIQLRTSDDFLEPLTKMTESDGEEIGRAHV